MKVSITAAQQIQGTYTLFEFSGMNSHPAEGDRLFAWVFIPTAFVCQIAPHYFEFERFLGWEIHSNGVWFFLAGMVSVIFTFSVCGLVSFVLWVSDLRANASGNNGTKRDAEKTVKHPHAAKRTK